MEDKLQPGDFWEVSCDDEGNVRKKLHSEVMAELEKNMPDNVRHPEKYEHMQPQEPTPEEWEVIRADDSVREGEEVIWQPAVPDYQEQAPPPAPPKINGDAENEFQLKAGEYRDIAGEVLRRVNARSFQYQSFNFGGRLVRIDGYQNRRTITPMEKPIMADEIDAACVFTKYDGRNKKWVRTTCPIRLVESVMARASEFLPLEGIIRAPLIDPNDGRLIDASGYDRPSRHYFDIPSDLAVNVPASPTKEDARQSLLWIRNEFFAEFPFASENAALGAVSAVISGFLLPFLSACPGYLAFSPVPSSGKSTLLEIIGLACHGRLPSEIRFGNGNEEEIGKQLTATLITGPSAIIFDNLKHGLNLQSEQIAQVITKGEYTGRLLGESKQLTLPSRVLVMAAGNLVSPTSDMLSRFIPLNLDTKQESPETRTFKRYNLEGWVLQNRPRLALCVLTFLRAWHLHGRDSFQVPAHIKPSRFPAWEFAVRNPLLWIFDEFNPGALMEEAKAVDPQNEIWGNIYELWYAQFGPEPITARQLMEEIQSSYGQSEKAQETLGRALREYLEGGSRVAPINAIRVGRAIGNQRGIIIGGLRLDRVDSSDKTKSKVAAKWAVIKQG